MIQDFINSPLIRCLSAKPYWTVNIDEKKPLDILEYEKTGRIWGAAEHDERCLTNMSNVFRILNAIPKQLVYHLNPVRDGIIVLDIEKTCPDDIKETLLNLPFIYGEISMSGQGYHLILPCPALDETTVNRVAMKEKHGYYEILLHHYVSFTYNTILPRYNATNAPISTQTLWNELKAEQKNLVKKEYDTDISDIKIDFPQYAVMKDAVIRNFKQRFKKTPTDFCNDMSRYEFAVIGSVRYSLNLIMSIPMFARRVVLDEKQQIAFVYDIVTDILEHRAKHEEVRDGKPLLLYQVFNSFATEQSE